MTTLEEQAPLGAVADTARTLFISIVMPCLNEQQTVAVCVSKALSWLERSAYQGEVIVVDNGSTDGSPALALAAGARVVHEVRRGYGAALRRGFAEARGDWIIMGDADDTYDFAELGPLVLPLANGYEMCIGNRFAGGIAPGAMTWSHRYLGTPVLSFLIRLFCGLKVGDSQCGLRAFTRSALEALELRTDGMELASEMILKAARGGTRVQEAAVPYRERLGEAKLNTFRDGWRHLRFLLLATPHYLFTLPGGALTLAGIVTLLLALQANGIRVGETRWQPLFAGGIFVVVGLNALLLGFASSLYTSARGITGEDGLARFYRRRIGLEGMIVLGVALASLGLILDVVLALAGSGSLNPVAVAAIAQALIIVGANVVLAGFLAGLLDAQPDSSSSVRASQVEEA